MSKFLALNMANEVAKNPQVSLEKSVFGLHTSAKYQPTHSKIDSFSNFYDTTGRDLFERILESKDVEDAVKNTEEIECVEDGKYRLDICMSRDHQFVAMQLNEITDNAEKHLSPIRYYEGEDAEKIENLFA